LFQRIHPNPRLYATYHNELLFYGEEFLAPHLTPNMEYCPFFLAALDCLFNILAATLHISMYHKVEHYQKLGENCYSSFFLFLPSVPKSIYLVVWFAV
jgi:hypothetical protein